MSRIGNKPITIPDGVEVSLNGNHITVKGPKGTLEKNLHKNIKISVENRKKVKIFYYSKYEILNIYSNTEGERQ